MELVWIDGKPFATEEEIRAEIGRLQKKIECLDEHLPRSEGYDLIQDAWDRINQHDHGPSPQGQYFNAVMGEWREKLKQMTPEQRDEEYRKIYGERYAEWKRLSENLGRPVFFVPGPVLLFPDRGEEDGA